MTKTILSIPDIDGNILEFLDSLYYLKEDENIIHFIIKRKIIQNKKLIITSATASIDIYKMLFGKRLKVIEIDDIETKGEVIQDTSFSLSRQSFKKSKHKIGERIGDIPVITFKEFKDMFKNSVSNMHFGNCEGYDTLKGQDIAIIGTPHVPKYAVILMGLALGYDLMVRDFTMKYQLTKYNNFIFKFMTFDNEALKNIQLGLIESQLIQAVGRNRVVREECKGYVFSNLPLKQTNKFVKNIEVLN